MLKFKRFYRNKGKMNTIQSITKATPFSMKPLSLRYADPYVMNTYAVMLAVILYWHCNVFVSTRIVTWKHLIDRILRLNVHAVFLFRWQLGVHVSFQYKEPECLKASHVWRYIIGDRCVAGRHAQVPRILS